MLRGESHLICNSSRDVKVCGKQSVQEEDVFVPGCCVHPATGAQEGGKPGGAGGPSNLDVHQSNLDVQMRGSTKVCSTSSRGHSVLSHLLWCDDNAFALWQPRSCVLVCCKTIHVQRSRNSQSTSVSKALCCVQCPHEDAGWQFCQRACG